jgi:tetratricopeptide (TPR) repeat protein
VRLPETGTTVSSNPLGFFDAGAVAAGSHRVELIVDSQLVQVDYATVVGGQLTLMTLTPSEPEKSASGKQTTPKPHVTVPVPATAEKEKTARPTETRQKSRPSAPRPGRIRLAANVDGARLSVDGRTLGAGNLLYSKIKSGRHNYVVDMDGYESARGTIEVKPGQTASLAVTLKPIEMIVEEEVDPIDLLLAEGTTALQKGNYTAADAAFTEVINLKPDHHQALLGRAQTHQYRGNRQAAYLDYLAAGDILSNLRAYNKSVTAYTNAIRMNGKGAGAYLGRADIYLAKGEAIAATADYEAVRRLDKRSARAYFGLGQARFKLGYYKKAIKHFKDARSLDKKNPLIYQYLMLSYLAVDDPKNVRKSFKKFKDVASDSELNRLLTDKEYAQAVKVAQSD